MFSKFSRSKGEQGAAENGFVAAFSTLEMTQSFTTFRGRNRDVLRRVPRKCKHYYFYWRDGRFGLTQVRIASWFPFSVHIMINGREWLARQMDERGLGYLRADNCFVQLQDFDATQQLAFEQPRLPWVGQLNRLLRRVHPLHAEWFCGDVGAVDYYWTAEQTEWATDIVFHDPRFLRSFFPQCVRHGLDTFGSGDVMRFLGHKTPQHGGVNGHYAGQVIGTLTQRSDGLRIKHRIGKNTLKMYLKQPNLIRVETTLNDGRGLKVSRPKHSDPDGGKHWLDLRKSVQDLGRRAELSEASNGRYLDAMSAASHPVPLCTVTDKLCQPVVVNGRRHRGLRPFHADDVRLFEIISGGEFLISGLRNRDIRQALYGETDDPQERRRQSARVSRKLALLRAHGLLKKIPRTHRYLITDHGVQAITAIQTARQTPIAPTVAA